MHFFPASCHGISQEMALLCLSWFCDFPNGGDSLMCKPCDYGETSSVLVDLTNEQDAYFAMLSPKSLSGFTRLKKYRIFNEL